MTLNKNYSIDAPRPSGSLTLAFREGGYPAAEMAYWEGQVHTDHFPLDASSTVRTVRSLSPASVELGGEVVVTIDVGGYGAFGRAVETLPSGFIYVSSSLSDDAVKVEGQDVSFILLGETGFTYTVAVSSVAGLYSFHGVLTNSDEEDVPIGGDDIIEGPTASNCAADGEVSDVANNPDLMSDCEALLEGRDTLRGTATLNWSASTPIAQWDGVTVSGTPRRVTSLTLDSNQLTGEIPTDLGSLSNLTGLRLDSNQLTGEIPPELCDLSNLTSLWLGGNQLTGEIPPELGSLSNLALLVLDNNELTGEIPSEMGGLSNLTGLGLENNQLTGRFPQRWVASPT